MALVSSRYSVLPGGRRCTPRIRRGDQSNRRDREYNGLAIIWTVQTVDKQIVHVYILSCSKHKQRKDYMKTTLTTAHLHLVSLVAIAPLGVLSAFAVVGTL
jgi:hypothetical protein